MNEALKHKPDTLGVHFAVNIFIGTTILWIILRDREGLNPIWAIASLIAASDPVMKKAVKTFHGRIVNALIGCATGFFVLIVGGTSEWKIPLALSLSALISAYLVRVEVMFRQAPITAAIIVAGGLAQHSKAIGVKLGLLRVGEVFFGCIVGLMVTWLMSTLWPPRTSSGGDSISSTVQKTSETRAIGSH